MYPKRERRRHVRAVGALQCYVVGWGEQIGPVLGVTENISRNGLLVRWMPDHEDAIKPKLNEPISLAVELPAACGATEQRFIRCEGRVVRVSPTRASRPFWIAVEVHRMWFSGRKHGFRRSAPVATVAAPGITPAYSAEALLAQ